MAAAAQTINGVPISTLDPKYLHSNSTSHTWAFGAIAELIDNAYDPDVSATQLWIDKTEVNRQECLTFMDNGNGLDHDTMHKMLSFGYSDKTAVKDKQPIGMYGNGFKSGSMRLGEDAIVFSQSKSTSCIGMLSQTYLKDIGAEQIIVPIVSFEQKGSNKFSVREEDEASLQAILDHSPFKTQKELMVEIEAITYICSKEKTGTRIIIWNLRRTSTRATEFDFESDRYDIRIPSDTIEAMKEASHIPDSVYSLRAYCSILFLKPSMMINIRGHMVKTQFIVKSLAHRKKDYYNPQGVEAKNIPIIFGYNTRSKEQYGVMMYYKKRLIKAYERVGCQLRTNYKGVGVIGVIECDFLKPTHNKQSFDETDTYRRTMNSLGVKLEEYWKEIQFKRKTDHPSDLRPVEDTIKRPDQNWAQCEACRRWRKLPDGIDCSKLPDKWFCRLNPNPMYRSCQAEEEPEDSDDDQAPYTKTHKRQEREEKKKREKEQAALKRQEAKVLAELNRENERLKLQLLDKSSPSSPITPKSALNTPRKATVRTTSLPQAACSPSTSNGLPVISEVWSTNPLMGKRTMKSATPHITPKKPRVNGAPNSSVDVCPPSSPSVPANNNEDTDDTYDTDDDLIILDTVSTPKPQKPSFDLASVKTEQEQSEADVGMLMECDDDDDGDFETDVDVSTAAVSTAAVGTSSSPPPPLQVASCTTQTELPKVKEEEEDQKPTQGDEKAGPSTSNKSAEEHNSDVEVDVCNAGPSHLDKEDAAAAGPSCADAFDKAPSSPPNLPSMMMEAQQQQDQLLELMQAAAQERDSFKEQVHKLTCQLQDTEGRLQELSQANVKKECSHQASQTEETGAGTDYKNLFEKAKQKVQELIQDKKDLVSATQTKPNTAQGDAEDLDDIAVQVDSLVHKLDQTNTERDELRSQLDNLEEERANLASKCEELRLSLQQQQREHAQEGNATQHRATNPSIKAEPEETGGAGDCGTDPARSLIELRHNIGRLLVSYVPALDLGQVNYECNVIDEILEQVISNEESSTTPGQNNRDINV